jgi:hypothetical protein
MVRSKMFENLNTRVNPLFEVLNKPALRPQVCTRTNGVSMASTL